MTDSTDTRPPLEPARLSLPAPYRVEVVESTASTNSEIAAAFESGASEGLVIAAEHQTAGRGRMGRDWVTPARSSVTMSFLLTPDVDAQRWSWLPLLTGIAVADAVRRTSTLQPRLKWPNDVLVNDKKVAGILLERVEKDGRAAAIVGVGINVWQTPEELPIPLATSLAAEGDAPDRTDLLGAIVTAMSEQYDEWRGGADPRDRYRSECGSIGQAVVVHAPNGDLSGTVSDIDETGRLVLATATGEEHLAVGDVEYVRAQP